MKNKVKFFRKEKGWSQAKLGEEIDVSRQTVNAIETGKYNPSLPLAFKLSHLFGKTIEEMFEPDTSD